MRAAIDEYLIDTCSFVEIFAKPELQTLWSDAFGRALVRISPATEIEVCHSASAQRYADLLNDFDENYIPVQPGVADLSEARRLQHDMFTATGQTGGAGPVDLILATIALTHGLVLITQDGDFAQLLKVRPHLRLRRAEDGPL